MWPKAAPVKLENLLQGGGRVGDTENTLLYRNFHCLCSEILLLTPGKTQPAEADRQFTEHKGSLPAISPWPRKKKKKPSKFVIVSIPATCGIKTTSWNCKSAARINVFPPSKKERNDIAQIWYLSGGLFWMNKNGKGLVSFLMRYVLFFMPQFVNCNCGFPFNCRNWAEKKIFF